MVVGITVAGLTKPTRMAEAEAIGAIVLRKIDPSFKSATGARQARQLNLQRPAANATGSGAAPAASSSGSTASATTGQKVRVANTGGTGVRMRLEPSLKGQIVARLAEGTVLEVVGEDKTADGYTWKNVRGPGDGRGWVAGSYLVSVTGGTSPPQATTPASTSSSSTSPPATTAPASSSTAAPPTTSTSGDALKVDVSAKQPKLKAKQEQVIEITVTRNGAPVPDAQVTVRTMPTGETPTASKTDKDGKSRVTWQPDGTPGQFVGVGVCAAGPDGCAGVGATSFEITG
jgi:hypothetical protein